MNLRICIAACCCWIALIGCELPSPLSKGELEAIAGVEGQLSRQTPEGRVGTIESLGKFSERRIVEIVVSKYVNDPDERVAAAARAALDARGITWRGN